MRPPVPVPELVPAPDSDSMRVCACAHWHPSRSREQRNVGAPFQTAACGAPPCPMSCAELRRADTSAGGWHLGNLEAVPVPDRGCPSWHWNRTHVQDRRRAAPAPCERAPPRSPIRARQGTLEPRTRAGTGTGPRPYATLAAQARPAGFTQVR
ncbi:hypothetical protein BC834DRAFT_454949 [Gloeopeniophorella convolvens]|nr:hypothetical protein BC834DRAFT_454949 [Gloeopeniophorella convolvens]